MADILQTFLKYIFVNENLCIFTQMSLKCVRKDPVNKKLALVQIMAWHWTGDKPLPEPMMDQTSIDLLTTKVDLLSTNWQEVYYNVASINILLE